MSALSITPSLLSDWLRRGGSLASGEVVDLRVEHDLETSVSRLAFVVARYSADAPRDMPGRLVVKSSGVVVRTPGTRRGEAQFYRELAPAVGTPPVVRCLAALDDAEGSREIIILEDLRATHGHAPWPLPPSLSECRLALEALARLHAQWWEAPTLGHEIGHFHTVESLTAMVHDIGEKIPAFMDVVGDRISTEGRRVYERVFSSPLRPWLRLTDPTALTVTHGDAHSWNFLFPRFGNGPAMLIDWQLWHLDLGARDLAFLIALHWYPSRRQELERPLLQFYHERLAMQRADLYGFEELWTDYRRCVVRNLTMPIIFWSRGLKPEGWWHRLECALAAYHDLGCEELL